MKELPPALILLLLLAIAFAYGCVSQPDYDNVKLDISYKQFLLGNTTIGIVGDSASFDRRADYFEIRARMTNLENRAYALKVMNQELAPGILALIPLYSREYVDGRERKWESITGVSGGSEDKVLLLPGDIHDFEQPVFFYNQNVSLLIPDNFTLEIEIADDSGRVITKKTIHVSSK